MFRIPAALVKATPVEFLEAIRQYGYRTKHPSS